jgi:hypothetical protein
MLCLRGVVGSGLGVYVVFERRSVGVNLLAQAAVIR